MATFSVTDNLFVRQSGTDPNGWMETIHNGVFQNNTWWGGIGTVFFTAATMPLSSCSGNFSPGCETTPYSGTLEHNVVWAVQDPNGTDHSVPITAQDYNIFHTTPTIGLAGTDTVNTSPTFKCATAGAGGTSICGNGTPAGDDYELASNPNGIGIDWDPASQAYGPE